MQAAINLEDILDRLKGMPTEQLQSLQQEVMQNSGHLRWVPNPGPQTQAVECEADELLYGGQAGGGKTDLLCGLSLTQHRRSLILRRTNREALGLVERYSEILRTRDGWSGHDGCWRVDGRVIDIGGCQLEDDKQKFKGKPRDFIGFDELSDFTESQFTFITGWNRSVDQNQRCRVVGASNPPTKPEGLWMIRRWAAWLDPTHPRPAKPGEIRWYTNIKGVDTEVDGPGPHVVEGEEKPVVARSRTFIPAALSDNAELAATNYDSVLAGLPEELRHAYRGGRFDKALADVPFQVCPSAWVIAAQERWRADGHKGYAMTAMALDPAGGGEDSAEMALRYGGWYGPLISAQGEETADGSSSAATVVKYRRNNCPVVVDVGGGYGGAVMMRLKDNGVTTSPFNGAASSTAYTKDGQLRFRNKRAECAWKFREELDPDQEGGSAIALPPDPELRSDLCAMTWKLTAGGILIESKDDLRERLGRSPGKGEAVMMALSEGNKAAQRARQSSVASPKVIMSKRFQNRR